MGGSSSKELARTNELQQALERQRKTADKLKVDLDKQRRETARLQQQSQIAMAGVAAATLLGGLAAFVLRGRAVAAGEQLLRTVSTKHEAALVDVRRRAAIDVEKAQKFSVDKFGKDLLLVADSLEYANKHIADGGKAEAVVEGVRLTEQSLLDVLGKHGITKQDPLAEKFDPNLHEAVMRVEDVTGALEPGEVAEVFRSGYFIHDRILRAAQVGVVPPREEVPPPTTEASEPEATEAASSGPGDPNADAGKAQPASAPEMAKSGSASAKPLPSWLGCFRTRDVE